MLKGRCACGTVSYTLSAKPMAVHCCHCTDCQRLSGAAYAINAIIETDHVTIDGPTSETTLPTPSGNGQVITSCAHCGTALCSNYLVRQGKLRHFRVGTLTTPEACPPTVQIFTSAKQPWVPLNTDIPAFENFYNVKETWPPEAYARWTALFGDG